MVIALAGGCYSPTFTPGGPCDVDCPGDLVCIDHVCRESGWSGDGGPDARTIDGPPGDDDADGVLDNLDNCPTRANPDQHDEDIDEIGDVCDPCPHIKGSTADVDADGVGDDCDPQPTIAKERIEFFDPFTSDRIEWNLGTGAGRLGETLRINAAAEGGAVLSVANGESRIVTEGTIAAVASATPHQFSLMFGVDANVKVYHYAEFWDNGPGTGEVAVSKASYGTYTSVDVRTFTGPVPAGAFAMHIDESVGAQTARLDATLGGISYTVAGSTSAAPVLTTSAEIHLYLQHIDVRLDYFLVIETLP